MFSSSPSLAGPVHRRRLKSLENIGIPRNRGKKKQNKKTTLRRKEKEEKARVCGGECRRKVTDGRSAGAERRDFSQVRHAKQHLHDFGGTSATWRPSGVISQEFTNERRGQGRGFRCFAEPEQKGDGSASGRANWILA